jgi:hypothetical protein
MSRIRIYVASSLIVAALAGCAGKPADNGLPAIVAAPEPAPSLPPVAGTNPGNRTMPANLQSIIAAATQDAASRMNIDPGTIEFVRALHVTWSDGSLGCPAPGMQYTQALVPGYRVILRAGGQTLDYHAAANGHLALCPPGRAIEPVVNDQT